MKITPKGHFVLIEIIPVQEKTESGIIIASAEEVDREHTGRDIGKIIAFGPTCFKGFAGCDSPADWGVKVGDTVEFERYDGKITRYAETHKEFKSYRVIANSDIKLGIEV